MSRAVQGGASRWAHWVVRTAEVAFVGGVAVALALLGIHLSSASGDLRASARQPGKKHLRATQASRSGKHHGRSRSTHLGGLKVVAVTPSQGATGVSPTATVTVRFSAPLSANSPDPSLSPAEAGIWRQVGPSELTFQPSAPAMPLASETLRIPGALAGIQGVGGNYLAASVAYHWQVRDASVLRLQQVLATLGYLPLTWTPSSAPPTSSSAELAALYQPPNGQFAWRWANTPATLQAAWSPGVDNHMTAGAMVSFEVHDGLPGYTSIRPLLWPTLLSAEAADRTNPVGYTYALVSQQVPEAITLWHDGADVYTSAVNTGIGATPTPTGTYFVYRRFASTTMEGTNPNGSYYVDHGVRWVNYFDGGVAIHGFIRASYGFPQSLGCVELPVANAAVAWNWIHYGTLVTVLPEPATSGG